MDKHIASPLNNSLGECEQHLINIVEIGVKHHKPTNQPTKWH
jgi:hypothetical protein